MAEQVEAAPTHTDDMSRRRRSWPSTIRRLLGDLVMLARGALTSRAQLATENLFLRKAAGPLPGARRQAETARS
jgi:hypothetical protein